MRLPNCLSASFLGTNRSEDEFEFSVTEGKKEVYSCVTQLPYVMTILLSSFLCLFGINGKLIMLHASTSPPTA